MGFGWLWKTDGYYDDQYFNCLFLCFLIVSLLMLLWCPIGYTPSAQ